MTKKPAGVRAAPRRSGRGERGERTAGIISLGCSKNLVDTEYLMGSLRAAGWRFTGNTEEARLLVVTTCAFIEGAVAESHEAVEEALAAKERHPGLRVAVIGCLVNRFRRKLTARFPGIDFLLTPGEIPLLPALLEGEETNRRGGRSFLPAPGLPRAVSTGPWAYLKIADGCDNRCGYCLIPAIRGRLRNRPAAAIVGEAAALAAAGVREINLVAQDTTRWRDGSGRSLPYLLERLEAVPGEFRLRLLYLHPARVDDALVSAVAGNPLIFPYFDVPLQHASSRVLAAMRRGYDRRSIGALYRRLRRAIPDAALRTTVLVGYPGEGRSEFRELLGFLCDHPFENLGAFAFSPQPGTLAATLPGRVSPEEAEDRRGRVMEQQAGISRALWATRRGRETEALLTGPADGSGRRWLGRTAWQAPEVDGGLTVTGPGRPGALVRVVISGSKTYDLSGRIL